MPRMVNTPRDLLAETRGVLASHQMVKSPRNRRPASIGEFAGPHRPFPLESPSFSRLAAAPLVPERATARRRRGPRAGAAARAAALRAPLTCEVLRHPLEIVK